MTAIKINYKKFTKHAEKVAKAASSIRPILKGIHHDAEGNLSVTDSYRLYHAKNVNAPKDAVLCATSGEELEGKYPDITRIIPKESDARHDIRIGDVKPFIKMIKAMQQAGMMSGDKKAEVLFEIVGDKFALYMDEACGVTFEWELRGMIAEHSSGDDLGIRFSAQYFIEAIEMMDDMGANSVVMRMYGNTQPFTIVPETSDDVLALIMPVRKY